MSVSHEHHSHSGIESRGHDPPMSMPRLIIREREHVRPPLPARSHELSQRITAAADSRYAARRSLRLRPVRFRPARNLAGHLEARCIEYRVSRETWHDGDRLAAEGFVHCITLAQSGSRSLPTLGTRLTLKSPAPSEHLPGVPPRRRENCAKQAHSAKHASDARHVVHPLFPSRTQDFSQCSTPCPDL